MYYLAGVIWLAVIVFLAVTWFRDPEKVRDVFRHFLKSGRIFVGIVPMALLTAGFLTPLVPEDFVARWLGESAGMTAILIGTAAGWLMPVPPIVFYPIIAVLLKTGAGMPALTALITAWSVFGIHRTVLLELPMMGRYFVTVRLVCSMAFPPLAGLIAYVVADGLGIS